MPDRAPLDDPAYAPEHPPINGIIPPVVARWGPKSQRRWFRRFRAELKWQSLDGFYCESEHHVGSCCDSCAQDAAMGYGGDVDGYCCCQDERMGHG